MSGPIVVQEQEDSLSTFGKYVAGELREMSSSEACIVKIKIQQAIMEGQAQCVMEHLGGTHQPLMEHNSFIPASLNTLN